jgi:hypothetical protein
MFFSAEEPRKCHTQQHYAEAPIPDFHKTVQYLHTQFVAPLPSERVKEVAKRRREPTTQIPAEPDLGRLLRYNGHEARLKGFSSNRTHGQGAIIKSEAGGG